MKFVRLLAATLLVISITGSLESASGQTVDNLLLVVNDRSATSLRIGEYYQRKRRVPAAQVVHLETVVEEEISRPNYEETIEAPLAAFINSGGLHDRILFVVLTKGIPIRITGTGERSGTRSSVDSELTLLYRRMAGRPVPVGGPQPNPYFLGDAPLSRLLPFSHREHDIFLVTRLDGYTEADAIQLIDRGASPRKEGRILLDQRANWIERGGNAWLAEAAKRLSEMGQGLRTRLDTSAAVLQNVDGVLGYYSWGSNDDAIRQRRLGLRFVAGSVAATFVSTDARTFREPPADWQIGTWDRPETWFAGSPQSLAGDLIREGVTGVAGHVSEPYLDATVRPHILFPAYLSGATLAEAFYLAMPYLSWQTIVIGDPLCAPFSRPASTPVPSLASIDPTTELPGYFAERRLTNLATIFPGTATGALAAFLKAESRLARDDAAGARAALEEAVVQQRGFAAAHLRLAVLFEQAGHSRQAVEHYRLALAASPNEIVALNNLAFLLSATPEDRNEALGLAERAARIAPTNGNVLDTVGWIQHLRGRHQEAVEWLTKASAANPTSGEIRLHLASAYAALGDDAAARSQLERAATLSPQLRSRADFQALRSRVMAKD